VVMLHGNPTWSFMYRNLIAELQVDHRVVAPDHLGCGRSDKPQAHNYCLADHIANLEKLIDQLEIDRFSLVVHDWGGAIGMGYAVRHPERIEAMVIMNTAAFHSRHIPQRIRLCRAPLLGELLVRGANLFVRAALHMTVCRRLPREIQQGYLAPYDSWRNRIGVMRFVQDIPMAKNHPSHQTLREIENGLAKLQDIPALILWGGKDWCFNRHFLTRWQEILPKAACHCFEDAGHYLLEDAQGNIEPRIHNFLDKIKTPNQPDRE